VNITESKVSSPRTQKVRQIIYEGYRKDGDDQAAQKAEEIATLLGQQEITTLGTYITYVEDEQDKKKLAETPKLKMALIYLDRAAKGAHLLLFFIFTFN
jgi:hypothetical protein